MSISLTESYVKSVIDPCAQGNWEPFLSSIAPDVHWWISSEEHDPESLTGIYNFAQWRSKVNIPVFSRLLNSHQDMVITSLDVVGQKVIFEAKGEATQKNGRPYRNRFCWILIFDDESKKIVEIREYMNTALVKEVITTNAGP